MAILMALFVIVVVVVLVAIIGVMAAVAAAVAAFLIFVAAVVCLIVLYLLDSYAKFKLFRLFGVAAPSCAFIPFYSNYLLGHMCTGRDGYFDGLFGMAIPNIVMEIGWLYMFASYFGAVNMRLLPFISREQAELLFAGAVFLFGLVYWSNIWAFVFSRLEGKSVDDVVCISIVSSIIGVVALVRVISFTGKQVYSMENDVYPYEVDDTED